MRLEQAQDLLMEPLFRFKFAQQDSQRHNRLPKHILQCFEVL